MANYIGKKEANAIIKFLNPETPDREKTKLYDDLIYPGLKKLCDELIKRYNLKAEDPNNDLREDLVSILTRKLDKFDPTRGSAFSFFNMCCNNELKSIVTKKPKYVQIKAESYENSIVKDEFSITTQSSQIQEQLIDNTFPLAGEKGEFVKLVIEELVKYAAKSTDEEEKQIAKSLVILIENAEYLPASNKRDILSMIRSITDYETRDISKHIKVYKEIYFQVKKTYYEL